MSVTQWNGKKKLFLPQFKSAACYCNDLIIQLQEEVNVFSSKAPF